MRLAYHIAALLLGLVLCLTLAACDRAAKTEGLGESPLSTPVYSAEGGADGRIDTESGSAADYTGLYKLIGSEGDAPFTLAEISEDNGGCMYLYKDDELLTCCNIDYSEQRALNGNALMVITFEVNGSVSEIGVFPSATESSSELHMRGYGSLDGFTAAFEKIDGTMLQ